MQSYGNLRVFCGPMFSGKTTELLKRILWTKNGEHQKIQVFKPAFDQRYQKHSLVSHEGLASPAEAINEWYGVDADTRAVFFDEVHFFVYPHYQGQDIISVIKSLLKDGVDVAVSGLDMDWQGEPFNVTAQLMAMAEEVKKLQGVCAVCGRPSTRSYKKTRQGASIELGANELYEPRCTHHWAKPDDDVQLSFDFDGTNTKNIVLKQN